MVEPRNFIEDFQNSNDGDLRNDWLRIFKLKFGEECIIDWKDDKNTQKGFGTDITIQTKQGRRYSVELKTRKNSCYGKDWIMEIVHQYYDKEDKDERIHLSMKEGWIYNTTAEYIFHATLDETGKNIIEVIFYSVIPFKTEKWKSEFEKYSNLWLSTQYPDKFQLTLNKEIPEQVIKEEAIEFWRWKK